MEAADAPADLLGDVQALAEARYRAIVEMAQEGICTTDAAGRLTYVNARLCEMLGLWQSELVGRYETDLLDQPGRDVEPGSLLSLLPPGHSQGDFVLRRKDGAGLDVSVSTGPIAAGDRSAGGITLFTDITERKHAEDRLRSQAFHDALTGLPNRTLFEDRVRQAILGSKRMMTALGLLFIDLDRFKEVNDVYGHEAGDEALRAFARRLRGVVRESDTVARFGGDEFLVLLAPVYGEEDANKAAKRIHQSIASPLHVHGRSVRVGASIGVATYPVDGDDLDTLLRKADEAMYVAKRQARA